MNFDYTADQRALKDEARKFLAARCGIPRVRAVLDDPARTHDAGLWQEIVALGWPAGVLPEAHGGLGLGHVELCAIAEELGRALAPVPFASTVYFYAQALLLAGSPAQQAEALAPIAGDGRIGAFAIAEGPRADALPPRPAVRFEGGRLYGEKWPVVDGGIAEVAVVLASEGADGRDPSLVLVDLRAPQVERTPLASLDPTRDLARLRFDGAPAERLGERGAGLALAARVLDRAAALVAFEQIGGADRCLEVARDFALERQAFGRPIGSYQAIKHKLADVFVRNQLARSNAYHAAWALDAGDPDALTRAAAAARIAACDAYWHAAKECIQTHGGIGFTWEVDAHLHYRRAEQLALVAGAPAWWKQRLVDRLVAGRAARGSGAVAAEASPRPVREAATA